MMSTARFLLGRLPRLGQGLFRRLAELRLVCQAVGCVLGSCVGRSFCRLQRADLIARGFEIGLHRLESRLGLGALIAGSSQVSRASRGLVRPVCWLVGPAAAGAGCGDSAVWGGWRWQSWGFLAGVGVREVSWRFSRVFEAVLCVQRCLGEVYRRRGWRWR